MDIMLNNGRGRLDLGTGGVQPPRRGGGDMGNQVRDDEGYSARRDETARQPANYDVAAVVVMGDG